MYKDIRVDSEQLEAALAARLKIRAGFDKPTAGMAAGMTQVNMISVPKDWAYDFLLYAHRNPQSCPVLDVLEEGVYATDWRRTQIYVLTSHVIVSGKRVKWSRKSRMRVTFIMHILTW